MMAYHQIPLETLSATELIPQAIIGKSGPYLAGHLGIDMVDGYDDFDGFQGAALAIDNGPRFALKHYRGYPPDTVTIYLPQDVQRLDAISTMIGLISDVLRIPTGWIVWQRKDAPDL